jgi:hypothetical protein
MTFLPLSTQGEKDTYLICAVDWVGGTSIVPVRTRVTFVSSDKKLKLPDPRYIALHAACAQVTHAAGMAEYLDEILDDIKDLRVLPEDGCSDVLMNALRCVAVY